MRPLATIVARAGRALATALVAASLAAPARAQDAVDVGVLKNADLKVVQNVLYPKDDRLEVGVHLGWMPFDPLVTTPNLQLSIDKHFSETLALSVVVGGGYGLKTLRYAELEGPAYGVAPYAFRYLASGLIGVSWSPIYGKMTAGGKKVVHYDLFFTARAGATLEQSVLGDATITGAPTVSLGLGTRWFVNDRIAVRFELKDDLLAEYRSLTSAWYFKQNLGMALGVTFFGKRKDG